MNLPPFIGSKEIAIPDQVQVLLSQSCDAKEIVLQLRGTIKVEDASLEQPDSETKALIRCVARKAKESNRPDVFQHLRKIVPAGCTGELGKHLVIDCLSNWSASYQLGFLTMLSLFVIFVSFVSVACL